MYFKPHNLIYHELCPAARRNFSVWIAGDFSLEIIAHCPEWIKICKLRKVEPEVTPILREGFTVVEWGGAIF